MTSIHWGVVRPGQVVRPRSDSVPGVSEWVSGNETSGLAQSQVDLAFRVAIASSGLTSPSRGDVLFSDDEFLVVAVLGLN